MLKFKILNQNKITKKNIIIILIIIFFLIIFSIISKSFAIYKLQSEYNLMKSKIGDFEDADIAVTAVVNRKQVKNFPKYTTNYRVDNVECSNGAIGKFDVENWALEIDNLVNKTITCTIYFNSLDKNEEIPIEGTIDNLIEQNKNKKIEAYNRIKQDFLNDVYPIGSIYITNTEDTIDKVHDKFGGTWIKYSEGQTLIGVNDSYAIESSGGVDSVELNVANLPNHYHTIIPTGSVTSTFAGVAGYTGYSGNHAHTFFGVNGGGIGSNIRIVQQGDGNLVAYTSSNAVKWANYKSSSGSGWRTFTFGVDGATPNYGSTSHTVIPTGTVSSSYVGDTQNTSGCSDCGTTAVNVMNPYTAVYMYKRIK